MYTKQQASLIRQEFWTSFGQYMKPVKGADGEPVNWLNYKTGIKGIYFRLDADQHHASIAIEVRQSDPDMQAFYYQKLLGMSGFFNETIGEDWEWKQEVEQEDGNVKSSISKQLKGVNIFRREDWPAIISYLKPRMIALDAFWTIAKEMF